VVAAHQSGGNASDVRAGHRRAGNRVDGCVGVDPSSSDSGAGSGNVGAFTVVGE
jgi:hypothetical protein